MATKREKPGEGELPPEPAEVGTAQDEPLSLRPVELKILLCAAILLALIALLGRYAMLPGALCGAAIAYGNFFFIRKILEQAVTSSGTLGAGFVVKYVLKFLGLVTLVYLVIRSGRFDTAGFLIGLSSLVLGILLEGLSRAVEAKN